MPVVVAIVTVPLSRLQASRKEETEALPYLNRALLLKTRSRNAWGGRYYAGPRSTSSEAVANHR